MQRSSFHLLFAAILSSCASTPAVEQPPAVETPAVEAYEAPQLPEIDVPFERFVLSNGLTVIVHEDHKAPVVGVNVWYHVGSKNEKPGKTGFAHLFEHLMFQGSENFKGEFFEPMEAAGATDLNGTTNNDRTNYFETVPTPALDMALWMESDRMGHFAGAISQERLDEQRGVVQNEKRQGQNQPYGKAWEILAPNTFPAGHPYSWSVIGSMEDLNAASLEDVRAWFSEYYGAANAVVVLAGDITVVQAKQKMEKFFGDIPAGPPATRPGKWIAPMTERREMTAYDQVPQERLYLVWNVPPYGEEDTAHLDLVTDVLGSGKNSRFYKRLVYDDQLATSVNVWLDTGEIASQVLIIADARPGVPLADVERALFEELRRFVQEGPTADEVARAQTKYFANQVRRLERVGGFGGKSDLLARSEVLLGDAGGFRREFELRRTTTPTKLREAAARWLGDGYFALSILPAEKHSTIAAGAARDKVPGPGDAPDLRLPQLQRGKLGNGIEVVLAERHDVPLVRVKLRAGAGFASETDDKLGVASLAMNVLGEGTEKRGSLELSAELERLGVEMGADAGIDASAVTMSVMKTNLEPALDLFAEVALQPAFAEEELERRRKHTLAGIGQEKARPVSTALRLLGPIMFGAGHPYGKPLTGSGTEATVAAVTRDDLVAYHQATFRPENVSILVVGDTSLQEMLPLLEARFGSWAATAGTKPGATPKAKRPTAPRLFLIDKPGAEQSLIIAGNIVEPRNSLDEIAVDAMNAIFGGTFTSRLNMNLREDKHWSYGARSFIFETTGEQLFGAYAQVQSDKTSESIVEIQKELAEFLGVRPATPAELTKTQENKSRRLPGQNETTSRVLSSVTEIVKYGLPDDYFDTFVKRLLSLQLPQIGEAAKRVIRPGEMTWVVVGDLSKIEAKVRALEIGDVMVLDTDGKPVR